MIDANKLRNTIDELENHSVTLGRVAELYNKLEKFKAELDALHNIISDNGNLFRETERDLRAVIEVLKSQLANMPVELQALRTDIDKSNAAMSQEIGNRFKAFDADQKLALQTLLNDIQSLQNKHKSDIEVAIRNEGAQLQRALENVVKENHLALQTILDKRLSDMDTRIIEQRRYSFIGFALMGMNAVLILLTLWVLHQ